MSTPVITPYQSEQRPGRDDFPHLLRSEWTKFRTVRGWVIAMIAAALLTVLAVAALAATANGTGNPGAHPTVAIGPGGEAVTDNFYFVHQPLTGNGSITVRVTSLTDTEQPGQPAASAHQPSPGPRPGSSSRPAPSRDRRTRRSWPPPATGCGCSTTTPTTSPACPARRPRRRRAGCG